LKAILSQLKIQVNSNLYLKDPHTSELGGKIIRSSIRLIDGFDSKRLLDAEKTMFEGGEFLVPNQCARNGLHSSEAQIH